jgi:hypothetical protein
MRKQCRLGLRRSDKQQATHHGCVFEKVDELYGKGRCAVYLPEGVPYDRRWNQEDYQCHGCQSGVDAEGQAKAPNYFNGPGTQHEPGDQAGGCAMFDECFRSHGLADDSETIQQKYDCDENTRQDCNISLKRIHE